MIDETYTLPKAAPNHNHGRTPAAWVLCWGVAAGALLFAIGIITAPVLMWVGGGVMALSAVASAIMAGAGLGQPRVGGRPTEFYGA